MGSHNADGPDSLGSSAACTEELTACIESACGRLENECGAGGAFPAANAILSYLPDVLPRSGPQWREAIRELAGVHMRALLACGQQPNLDDYLTLCNGDPECEDELRGLLSNLVGPFSHVLDVEIVHPIRPRSEDGQSVVYAARERSMDQGGKPHVVVKAMHPDLRDSPHARDRFRQEVELLKLARDHTDAVVRIYESGLLTYRPDAIERVPAYVMEQCKGSLHDERDNYKGREAVVLMGKVASAVAALHQHGIVLRDLKPGNVLLRRTRQGDEPVLADLGLAKDLCRSRGITECESFVRGTPGFRSPQAVLGIRPDDDAGEMSEDVYGFGATFYTLLHPDHADLASKESNLGDVDCVRGIVEQGLPDVDMALRDLITSCLAPEPSDRPTMERVAERLRLYLRAHASAEQPARKTRKWALIFAAVATFVVSGVLTLHGLIVGGSTTGTQADRDHVQSTAVPVLHETRITDTAITLVYRVDPTAVDEALKAIMKHCIDDDAPRAFEKAGIPKSDWVRIRAEIT